MKKILVVLLSVMLLGSMAACKKEEVAAQGVTDDKVLIANCAATSGAFAPVGVPFTEGIKAYLAYVNSKGGVDGREIEILHNDD